jgi:putative oligomerization/nucleic acid binding protein
MLLVPRQLRRAGMTGDVPYYGGRLSPAQAYAVSHPGPPPASVATAVDVAGRTARPPARPPAPPPAPAPTAQPSHADTLASLRHLLDSGVISADEYEQLRARVTA